MPAQAHGLQFSGQSIDLSGRVGSSSTIVGSPALAAETVVCSVTGLQADCPVVLGVFVSGVVSFTVGTSGASVRLRIRTGTTAGSGTTVADTGAITGGVTAANLLSQDLQGFDTAVVGGAVPGTTSYCLTLTIGSGGAVSTVTQTNLFVLMC